MVKKRAPEFQSEAGLSGLFAQEEPAPPIAAALAAFLPEMPPAQARLLALYPAGRELRYWHIGTGWVDCVVLSARPHGELSVRVKVQTRFGPVDAGPNELKGRA